MNNWALFLGVMIIMITGSGIWFLNKSPDDGRDQMYAHMGTDTQIE